MKILFVVLIFLQPMLSAFVSEKEAFGTNTGLSNVPTKEQYAACKKIATEYFDPLRRKIGSPLYISSMFRSPAVNKAAGGAKYSDHQVLKDKNGHYTVAIDIDQDGRGKVGNRALFFIIMHECEFKKLIWEFDNPLKPGQSSDAFRNPRWVHWAVSTDPEVNKLKRVYRAVRQGNKTVYLNFKS